MLSSSLSLSAGSLFLLWLSSPAHATEYELMETWQGEEFFNYFHFYDGPDPTNGWVNYMDGDSASKAGLVKITDEGTVYLGVDHATKLSPSDKGRNSVRVGTNKYYEHSLVIADIAHMPGNACGSWPAFWTVGKEWPGDGEIDIIEGVNMQDHNEIVMHTSGTCALKDEGMSGYVNATGCGEALGPVGCVIEGDKGSYGTLFNQAGGGVYAMEWTEEFVKIWHFPRNSIPESITKGEPDTSEFGIPMALVEEGCDVANSFKSQSFVFDVTFCGDWAGGVFGESGCPMSSSDSFASCTNFVAQNPDQFKDTYWEINSVKVYQAGVKGPSVPSHPHSSTHEVSKLPITEPTISEPYTVETHAPKPQSTETHVAQLVELPVSKPTHPAEQHVHSTEEATDAVEKTLSVVKVHTITQSAAVEKHSSEPAPEAPVEQPVVTKHAKAPTTRYVTKFVTDTMTVCASSKESSKSLAPVDVIEISPSSSHNHEQPQPSDDEEAEDEQTTSVTQAPPSTSSARIPRHTSSAIPTGADAIPAQPSYPQVSTPTAGLYPQHPQSPFPTPSGDSTPIRPISPQSPQTSKPVIPRPSGDTADSSERHNLPPSSSTPVGAVFTGAADHLAIKVPMLAAAFGLAMVA
ncbi:uncharacterized protein N7483_006255 [Penicillium malachiteum]|uniref:uncharacterized protein n=1 Tax=Penicillium malachiteum TaxID=1324776 RepID=UPI002546D77C|nr:uncharacterized protein N7483_006255 [Penicillium malachiteum]KAJ5731747.1 hypothetical protein N7483_006255 [Penicillium malachiteum]